MFRLANPQTRYRGCVQRSCLMVIYVTLPACTNEKNPKFCDISLFRRENRGTRKVEKSDTDIRDRQH